MIAIFYNYKLRKLVILAMILCLLLIAKWKFGLYSVIDGYEITTGMFLTFCLFLTYADILVLVSAFLLMIAIFYGFYTFCGYFLFFYFTGITTKLLQRFFNKYFFLFPFYVFILLFTFWIWWLPVDFLFLNFNFLLALARIPTALFVNAIEAITNYGFVIIFYPIVKIAFNKFYKLDIINLNKKIFIYLN